jgi:hypothetical protein
VNGAFCDEQTALNAICPYFTMFPLRFPLTVLQRHARKNDVILDPFCGRGTTNFAARVLGLPNIGLDASPIAVAATASKLVADVRVGDIIYEARRILLNEADCTVPEGPFWSLAYHPSVLRDLSILRAALIADCRSGTRKALRGILLGALHGPLRKDGQFLFV